MSLRKNGGCWDQATGWRTRCPFSLDNLCKVQWALLSVWSVAAPVHMGLLDTNLEAAVKTLKIPSSQPAGEEQSVQCPSQTVEVYRPEEPRATGGRRREPLGEGHGLIWSCSLDFSSQESPLISLFPPLNQVRCPLRTCSQLPVSSITGHVV